MKQVYFFSLLVAIVFLPDTVSALGLVPCSGTECSACHFAQLGNTIFKWLVGVLFVVFAVVAAMGGFGLVTSAGNPSAMSDAKAKLVNAVVGILVVFAAWLLVDTILRGLLVGGTGQINGKYWYSIECGTQTATETAPDELTNPMVNGSPTPVGNPSVAGAGTPHNSARNTLNSSGINVKNGANLQGVKPHVISSVIDFNTAMLASCSTCKPVTVTEGTGGVHANGAFSHASGFKLDLRTNDNPGMVNYIQSTFAPAGKWKDGTPLYFDANACATYAIESDHVDVVYKSGC